MRRRITDEEGAQAVRRFAIEIESHPLNIWLSDLRGRVMGAEEAHEQFHGLFQRLWQAEQVLDDIRQVGLDAERQLARAEDDKRTSRHPS